LKRIVRILRIFGLEKNLGYVSIGNIANTFLGALLWLIIASRLSASEFGSLNYDISIASLVTSVGILGLDTTLTTYLAKGVNKMLYESTFLVILSGSAITIALLIFYPSLSVILLTISMIIFTLIESENLGNHKFKRYMWLMVIQRLITLLLVPVFFIFFGVEWALYGFVISYTVVSYEFVKWLRKIRISISTFKPITRYFLHSSILGISKVLPYFFDKLLILPLFGITMVGYYQFGVQILSVVSMLPVIFFGYILPRDSKSSSPGTKKTFLRFGILSSVLLTLTLFLILPFLIQLLFPKFVSAIFSAQLILLAGIPLTLSSIYNSVMMARGDSRPVVIGAVMFVGFQSIGIIVLGNSLGLIGLSISTVIGSIIQCIYLFLVERRNNRNRQQGKLVSPDE
jgi:O-antigen/teichoic acid export membrane protein